MVADGRGPPKRDSIDPWYPLSGGRGGPFVVRYNAQGELQNVALFGDSTTQEASSVAVDPSGNVLLHGKFSSPIHFGLGPLTTGESFLVKLSPMFVPVWSVAQTGGSDATVAVSAVYLGGSFFGTGSWGGGSLVADGVDVFLARFAP